MNRRRAPGNLSHQSILPAFALSAGSHRFVVSFLAAIGMLFVPFAQSAEYTLPTGFPWAISLNGNHRPDLEQNLLEMTLTEESANLRILIRFLNWGVVPGQPQPTLLYSDGPGHPGVGTVLSLRSSDNEFNCAIRQLDMLFPGDRPPEILAICTGATSTAPRSIWNLPGSGFTATFTASGDRILIKGIGQLVPGWPALRVGHLATLQNIGSASGNYQINRVEQIFNRTTGLHTAYSGVFTAR